MSRQFLQDAINRRDQEIEVTVSLLDASESEFRRIAGFIRDSGYMWNSTWQDLRNRCFVMKFTLENVRIES